MVLTRRATKELNSIMRWLPTEMLLAMCGYACDSTLASLCRTGRTLRALATPVLYRSVSLTEERRAKRFIETVASRPGLARHVRRLLLKGNVELPPRTTRTLTRILPLMTRLQDLDLHFADFWLEGGIGGASFSELRSFGGLAIRPSCASLQAFLDRHRSITALDVLCFRENENGLPAVHLPQLAEYAGSASFLSYLDDATVRGIRSLDLRILDANLGAVLSRCANLRRVAGTLVGVEATKVIETCERACAEDRAHGVPCEEPDRLAAGGCRRTPRRSAPIASAELLAVHVSVGSRRGGGHLGAACKTLVRVVLDGADWRRVHGQWTLAAAIQAEDEQ
ncbi:hypothetical protein MSAN_02500700 [Mycena sanguinolenta]|uniref:PI-PLC Y-box domain-containing protein n=1 Tax=Mycena sanguinolenta TaxID=230812 RepID=A0A8H6U1D6_9AGAR|nr:hypothetical protein MSAN_02500700 [Mycena sanguinolenta]